MRENDGRFAAQTLTRRRLLQAGLGTGALIAIGACSTDFGFGPFSGYEPGGPAPLPGLPSVAGKTIGSGPVRVGLLLPLSGSAGLAGVGTSMANAAQMAIDFIGNTATITSNITLLLKDTGGDGAVAANKASEAVSEGARLLLGPLRAEAVRSAGAVARPAGVPVIGFSNNTGVASPGVYLLNVLPEAEVRRSLSYARGLGRRAFGAIVPTTAFGRIQEGAFRQAISDLGLSARAIYTFNNETEARTAVEQLIPVIQSGAIDALFIPDRATAPSLGVLLEGAGIEPSALSVIGSADWDGDNNIGQTVFLTGAVYPAVDPAGYAALKGEYQTRFGGLPHPLATIAYTAVLLANSSSLSQASPPYNASALTRPSGFNGRDGLFRFLGDGRSEYSLIMKQVVLGGASTADGPKLPGAA